MFNHVRLELGKRVDRDRIGFVSEEVRGVRERRRERAGLSERERNENRLDERGCDGGRDRHRREGEEKGEVVV
jgi:hypothetical protein